MLSNLEQMVDYKNKIALALCSSENIVKTLIDGTNTSEDDELMYNIIYPTRQSFDMETKVGSYIFFEITNSGRGNDYWKTCKLTFYIVVHNDLLRTDLHGVRTDYLESEIDKLFNGMDLGQVRKLEFVGDTAGALDAKYYYRTITYQFVDTNNSLCR